MFSWDQFERSLNFIHKNGRELDSNLSKFEFQNKKKEEIIPSLRHYQNTDGGFGKGLECDLRTKNSTVIATTVAFQYFDFLGLQKHELINQGIKYLENNIRKFNSESPLTYFWQNVDDKIKDSPYAPWWNIENDKEDINQNFQSWANPCVEIIGYLNKFSYLSNKELLNSLNEDLKVYLESVERLSGFVYYDFLCFKRAMPYVSNSLQKKIFYLFDNTFEDQNLLSQKNLGHLKIQWFITEKSSYLYQKFPDKILPLIKNEIDSVEKDGGSHPQWEWGDENLWKQVEREWAGKITYEMLSMLKYCELLDF